MATMSAGSLILVGLVFLRTLRGEASPVCVWGRTCLLPCTFPFGKDTLIHWLNGDKYVHSYYDKRDHLEKQMLRFRSRTSLFHDEIPRGNASLLLMQVKVEDEGSYMCYTSTDSHGERTNVELKVEAPVHRVHIVQEKDRITCSSERIYPKPTLSWSSSPQEAHKAEAELMEEQLYRISSTIAASSSTQENHSCTVSAGRSTRRTTLFQPRHINASDDETTLSCFTSDPRATQLTWRFNHTQVIVTRTGTGGNYTTSDGWSKLVKNVSPSGDLQLEHLSPSEEGTFTCELSGDLETYVTSTQLTFSGHPETPTNRPDQTEVVVGGVVGVLLAVLIAALVICFIRQKMKERNESSSQSCQFRPVSSDGTT